MGLIEDRVDEFGSVPAPATRFVRRTILAEDAASIFLPVPWRYHNLRVLFAGRCSVEAVYASLLMRFAAGVAEFEIDAGNNYDWVLTVGAGSVADLLPPFTPHIAGSTPSPDADLAPQTFSYFGVGAGGIGSIPGADEDSLPGYAATVAVEIPNYSGAVFYKGYLARAGYRLGDFQYASDIRGTWKNTAPIRGIQVKADDGDLLAGSMLMLVAE